MPHLILMTHDHPLTQQPANSAPTLSCISAACGQFCYKPSVRFSGSSPEPKMPSSGNKLKSQLGTRNASEQKTLVHRHELGGGVQGSPAEHHATPVRASKQQVQHSGGNVGSPRDLSTQRETEIKVCLLVPPVLRLNCR